jgi:hypothetical protein
MQIVNLLVLMVSGALLGIALRNLLGRASPIGVKSGWVAMVGFAAMAAYCFWKAREFRMSPATAGAMAAAQKFMILSLIGLMVSAVGVTRQKKQLRARKPTGPDPSTSGPPAPSPPATS